MPIVQSDHADRLIRRYGKLLSAATGAAAAAGFSVYECLHPSGGYGRLWGVCTAASVSASIVLTIEATKVWLALRRPSPRTRARTTSQALPKWPRLLALPPPASQTSKEEVKMSAPNEAHAAEAPLSATRERYRREGYSESEISQILVARATASPAGKSFGSGVATGLLSNLDAILTYARGLLPGFRVDLERMVDGRADKATRLGGALKLAVKLCALGMIGYFLYIESIEFRARAYLAWANACVERQKNAINHTSMTDLLSGKKLDGDDDCVPR